MNVNIFVNQPSERGLFDPSRIGDPVAMQTQWSPLKSGGNNFSTHKATVVGSRFLFRASFRALLFYFMVLLIGGALMWAASVTKLPSGGFAFHVREGVLFAAGIVVATLEACLACSGTASIVFDREIGYFWKGRKTPNALLETDPLKNRTKLEDIHALQLISKYISSTRSARSYYSFELNLVLGDGRRINVVDHGDLTGMRADVGALSVFLGKPIWDLAS
jgi:hypothetical protein